jgi:predicted RNase H-like HicB family nuclease
VSGYCDDAVTIRILYHEDPRGWWAESPDIERWTVVGDTYDEVRALANEGVAFALAAAAEERGEAFEETRFADVEIEHYVPAPARAA